MKLLTRRTRDELLPFLQEVVDDDDDVSRLRCKDRLAQVLVAVAEQLGCGASAEL